MIKCICINDKDKPPGIPDSHWVKIGKRYTAVAIYDRVQPGAMLGVVLQEIDLTEVNTPYTCFSINRFGFKEEDLINLEMLIRNCEGLQDFDPVALIADEVCTGTELDDFDGHIEFEGEYDDLGEL